MKKSIVALFVLALVGCGKETPKATEKPMVTVGPVTATINGEPAIVTQTTVQASPKMNGAIDVKEIEPVASSLTKEQAKQAAQKLYKDIKSAQADGTKTMEFLSQYPEQGGEIRDVSVKFNNIIDSSKLKDLSDGYTSCTTFANFARLNWQDKYGLYQSEQRGAVTMSKIKMNANTEKQLAQYEKDCKAEIK